MVIVDTSVLVDYFRGIKNPSTEVLDILIDKSVLIGINNYIYQELLQGAKTQKEFDKLREYLSVLPFYGLLYNRKSYEMAANLYLQCRHKGVTIRSTIDLIIAQTAIENNLQLLHNDKDFTCMASAITNLKIYKV